MNADECIRHFTDMGVLQRVIFSETDQPMAILASAPRGYADRCMKDFSVEGNQYYSGVFSIDAVTDDDVVVRMIYVDEEE